MTNGMVNLRETGDLQLLQHRARCLDQAEAIPRAIQADERGNYRLLTRGELTRVGEFLDEAERCTIEFERRRREWSEDHTDPVQLAEAMRRQSEDLYSRSSF